MFQYGFSDFFECALNAMGSLEMILILETLIKGWRVTGSIVPLAI